jgi:hypothetical protein
MNLIKFLLCFLLLINLSSAALNLTEHPSDINLTESYLCFINQSNCTITNITNQTSLYNETTWIEFNSSSNIKEVK